MRWLAAALGLGAAYALWRALSSSSAAASEPSSPAPSPPSPDDDVAAGALLEQGTASWYPPTGRLTASGEVYDGTDLTCAHPSLPFQTVVLIHEDSTGNEVICRVNDRGPAESTGRIVDLSPAAADKLGFRERGLTKVSIFAV